MKQHKLTSRVSVKATQKSNITGSNENNGAAAKRSLTVGGSNNPGTAPGLSTALNHDAISEQFERLMDGMDDSNFSDSDATSDSMFK
jgi:hypothetical protein